MKNNSLVNWMGAGALALSLAILPSVSPATAQITDPGDTTTPTTTTNTVDNNDGFDWGWLGLLGLVGLAGLKGRDHDTNTSYSDRTAATSASNNPRY